MLCAKDKMEPISPFGHGDQSPCLFRFSFNNFHTTYVAMLPRVYHRSNVQKHHKNTCSYVQVFPQKKSLKLVGDILSFRPFNTNLLE